jgi:hypothetical protein
MFDIAADSVKVYARWIDIVTLYMGLDRSSTNMGFVAFYEYVKDLEFQHTSQSIKYNCEF